MIKINQYSIDVKLTGFDLPSNAIDEIIMSEELDGTLPTIQLTLLLTDYRTFLGLIEKTNTQFSVGVGTDEDNIEYYDLVISDYSMKKEGAKSKFTLYGIPNLKYYTNTPNIKSFPNMTTGSVLSKLTSITPKLRYTPNDSQTWVQHNIPDKEFVKELVKHAYVSDDDAVVQAINLKKELIVSSIKDAFKNPYTISFSNAGKEPDIQFNTYLLETNASLFQYLFSEGVKQSIIHIDSPTTEVISIDESSIMNKRSYNLVTSNKSFPSIIDCLNCHPKYYYASINNLKKKMGLVSKFIVLHLPDITFKESELTLLDSVKLTEKFDELSTALTGIYVIVKKSTHITGDAISTELVLARDFYSI